MTHASPRLRRSYFVRPIIPPADEAVHVSVRAATLAANDTKFPLVTEFPNMHCPQPGAWTCALAIGMVESSVGLDEAVGLG